jgi:hypothetical protein
MLKLLLVAIGLAGGEPRARDLYLASAKAGPGQDGPLGLRYSLLKKAAEGEFVEVDSDSWFRAGDSVRLSLEINGAAYLRVCQRGSSGQLSQLFSSDGPLAPGRRHQVPAKGEFRFDERPGAETLFIVLSRQPEPGCGHDLAMEAVYSQRAENAVYIVNRRAGRDARLVAEVTLKHR